MVLTGIFQNPRTQEVPETAASHLLMELTLGTVSLSQTPSAKSRSRISQANMVLANRHLCKLCTGLGTDAEGPEEKRCSKILKQSKLVGLTVSSEQRILPEQCALNVSSGYKKLDSVKNTSL